MEFITGLLAGICLFEAYLLYARRKPKALEKLDQKEIEEQKRREEHIQALLNYDVQTAYGGKK